MARLYTGDVRSMYIKNIEINENSKVIKFGEKVLRRDLFFYKNIFGKKINFHYGKQLPNKVEAMQKLRNGEAEEVIYADNNNLNYQGSVSFAKVLQIKKRHK